ncbi:MAG: hypothetical protein JSW41_04850 [Candidatus Aenigmatarchaeota archaeon]|nr:MAG: hypothetical protein JSW41_04850 [Candidatus Aenigmarchaeota archaeon]
MTQKTLKEFKDNGPGKPPETFIEPNKDTVDSELLRIYREYEGDIAPRKLLVKALKGSSITPANARLRNRGFDIWHNDQWNTEKSGWGLNVPPEVKKELKRK